VEHSYWVYVPAQYDASQEVSLMVFNDGNTYVRAEGAYRAQNVLDNLIYRRDIPIMIVAFIDPGAKVADGQSIRSEEYMTLGDRYSKVVLDELLPALYKDYKISRDPDRHGIAGFSAGAIAAFTVAWERPDQFHKVLTGIGAFVRDLHVYPEKVLASEKKPIRIFMVDGRNDSRGPNDSGGEYDPHRDFFLQNVRLMEALTKKGYDVNYSWGMGCGATSQCRSIRAIPWSVRSGRRNNGRKPRTSDRSNYATRFLDADRVDEAPTSACRSVWRGQR
jgi:enterochelin esterase family protein